MDRIKQIAFTLIELLVVIAIIGILSGLIVVSMGGMTEKATIAKAQVFSNSLRNALMMNIVAEWRFNENTFDSWSGGLNGTWSGLEGSNTIATYSQKEECVSGQCLNFDGYDDNVFFGADSRLAISSNWTFEHWMKWSGQSNSCVFYAGIGGTRPNFLLRNCSSANIFAFRDSSGTYHNFVSSEEYINKWTHVVWSADGSGNISLYINGQFATSVNLVSPATTSISINSIGRSYGGTLYSYLGKIDEVRLYNSVISTSKIKEEYFTGLNSLFKNRAISKEEYMQRTSFLAMDK